MDQTLTQRGLTLVELVIAIALSSIVIAAAYTFLRSTLLAKDRDQSRNAAIQTNVSMLEILKRDHKFQLSSQVYAPGHSLWISRKQKYIKGTPSGNYQVTYSSQCVPISSSKPAIKATLARAYDGRNDGVLAKTAHKCLASLKCSANDMPQVILGITGSGPGIPAYPQKRFPNITIDINSQSVGSALCFESLGPKIRVIAESAFFEDKEEAKMTVETEEILLAEPVSTNVDLMP